MWYVPTMGPPWHLDWPTIVSSQDQHGTKVLRLGEFAQAAGTRICGQYTQSTKDVSSCSAVPRWAQFSSWGGEGPWQEPQTGVPVTGPGENLGLIPHYPDPREHSLASRISPALHSCVPMSSRTGSVMRSLCLERVREDSHPGCASKCGRHSLGAGPGSSAPGQWQRKLGLCLGFLILGLVHLSTEPMGLTARLAGAELTSQITGSEGGGKVCWGWFRGHLGQPHPIWECLGRPSSIPDCNFLLMQQPVTARGPGALPPMWETQMGLLVPSLGLAVQAVVGIEVNQKIRTVSLCLSNKIPRETGRTGPISPFPTW